MDRSDPKNLIRAGKVTLPEVAKPYPTILAFLISRFPHIAPSIWKDRLANGGITDSSGEPLTLESEYKPGRIIYYRRQLAQEPKIPFEASILFQNEHILVADKPHFLPVMPVGDYLHETLLYRLINETGIEELSPLHRLDRETAGLVIFSAKKENRAAYQKLFQSGGIKKNYMAVGQIPDDLSQDRWTVATGIVPDKKWPLNKIVDQPVNATTEISLIETNGERNRALFRLTPTTGKTHQLRLHMAYINCPIVGDRFYPNFDPDFHISYDNPLQLLADSLSFADPISGEAVEFISNLKLDWPIQPTK